VKEVGATLSHNFDLEKESTSGLEFVGFQGIIDPPRKSAVEAIKHCHEAGITVVMITGDHKITASAIARQIGILSDGEMIVTGQEIDSSKNGFLRENLEKIKVYARVSPEHKTQIVNLLQERGNTVAVTGDGVNDAPALKKGHIGVAMGQIGTDVAREASEMVLKDDNFSTIFTAVELGRVIFDNIRKVTFFR
jgi:Ca2+-transporting ATPase